MKSVVAILRHYIVTSVAQCILRAETASAGCLLRLKIVCSYRTFSTSQVFTEEIAVTARLHIQYYFLWIHNEVQLCLLGL